MVSGVTWDDIHVVISTKSNRWQLTQLEAQLRHEDIEHTVCYGKIHNTPVQDYTLALDPASTSKPYILRFEDDVEICKNFGPAALNVIEAASTHRWGLISFYNGSKTGDRPVSLVGGSNFLMTQACLFCRVDLEDHNYFVEEWTRSKVMQGASEIATRGKPCISWDNATSAWLVSRGLKYVKVFPSMVQHLQAPSLIGHHYHPNRSAPSYLGWVEFDYEMAKESTVERVAEAIPGDGVV